jgi:hypothetical protein
VAIATAYTDEVTERLKIFLQEYGFDVTAAKGLGFTQIPDGRSDTRHPGQAQHGLLRCFEERRCRCHFLWRAEDDRRDRAG